jgi:hypothetical protein
MNRRTILMLIAAICCLAASLPALAAKGGNGGRGDSSISLLVLSRTFSASPHFGDQVTFAVATSATGQPWVNARCYQNGELVYSQFHGFYAEYYTHPVFTLGPTQKWSGGAADCVADLLKPHNSDFQKLASTSFHVDA